MHLVIIVHAHASTFLAHLQSRAQHSFLVLSSMKKNHIYFYVNYDRVMVIGENTAGVLLRNASSRAVCEMEQGMQHHVTMQSWQ